jgi:hypothetical protein
LSYREKKRRTSSRPSTSELLVPLGLDWASLHSPQTLSEQIANLTTEDQDR